MSRVSEVIAEQLLFNLGQFFPGLPEDRAAEIADDVANEALMKAHSLAFEQGYVCEPQYAIGEVV